MIPVFLREAMLPPDSEIGIVFLTPCRENTIKFPLFKYLVEFDRTEH